jgi:hypothetical protein
VLNNKRSREVPKDNGFKFVIPEPRLLSSSDDENELDRTTAHSQKRRKIAPPIAKTSLSNIPSGANDELDERLDLLARASEILSGARRLNLKIPKFLVNSKIPKQNPLKKPMIFVGTEEARDEFRSLGVREDLSFFVASDNCGSNEISGKFLNINTKKALSEFGPKKMESSEEDRGEDLEKIRDEKLIDLEKRNLENLHELTKAYLQKLSEINQDKNKIEEDFNHQKLETEERFRQKNTKAKEEITLITKEISQFEEQIKVKLGAKNLQLPKSKEEIDDKFNKEEERMYLHYGSEFDRCIKIRQDFENKINMEKSKVNEAFPASYDGESGLEEIAVEAEFPEKITEEKNQALKDRKAINLRIWSEKQKVKTKILDDIERREVEDSESFKEFKSQIEVMKKQALKNLKQGKDEVLQLFDKLQQKTIEIKTLEQSKSEEENKIRELLAKINKKRDEDLKILKERKEEAFQTNQSNIQDNKAIFEKNKKEIDEEYLGKLRRENSDDGLRSPSKNLSLPKVMPNPLSLQGSNADSNHF